MIERCTDPGTIMAMVEHPKVKPWLPPLTVEKMRDYLADPRTIAFVDDGVGAVFEWSAPGVYEGHLFFTVGGRKALQAGKALADIMLNRYAAVMLWGEVKLSNRHTRWFSRQVGFRSLGVEQRTDGPREVFVMERALCH
jgi:hypothetical protein